MNIVTDNVLKYLLAKITEKSVLASDIRKIEIVTEYPAEEEIGTLYLKVIE